jgi:hypothetical protein
MMFTTFGGKSGFLCASPTLSYSFTVEFFQTTYRLSPGLGGLAYLGLGIGFFLATILGANLADYIYRRVSPDFSHFASRIFDLFRHLKLGEKNGGVSTPEMRIPVLFIGSLFVPVGVL